MVDRPLWPEHIGVTSQGEGGSPFCGFAIEIGEAPEHRDYAAFKKMVLERSKLDVSGSAQRKIEFTTTSGARLGFHWGDTLADFHVGSDGQRHDWAEHGRFVWREAGKGEDGLLSSGGVRRAAPCGSTQEAGRFAAR